MIELFPAREIILTIGSFNVYWYGMMYFVGFMVGLNLFPRLQQYRALSLTKKQIDSLLIYIVLGTIIGGRLGYVLLWEPQILTNPLQVFMVWKGGMSSHGGMIGVTIAGLMYCRKYHVDGWSLADVLMILFPIGLALGRIGNFINLEIYGTVTTLPWGIEVPGVEGLRHPAQLYAVAKDILISILCYAHLKNTSAQNAAGRTLGLFLVLYGTFRFIVEYFRDQPFGYYDVVGTTISHGQLLTIPVFLAGILILLWLRPRHKS